MLFSLLKLSEKKPAKSYFPPNWFIHVLLIYSSICNWKLYLYTDTCILAINFILSYLILYLLTTEGKTTYRVKKCDKRAFFLVDSSLFNIQVDAALGPLAHPSRSTWPRNCLDLNWPNLRCDVSILLIRFFSKLNQNPIALQPDGVNL